MNRIGRIALWTLGAMLIGAAVATIYLVFDECGDPSVPLASGLANVARRWPLWGGGGALLAAAGVVAVAVQLREQRDSAGTAAWASRDDVAELRVHADRGPAGDGLTLGMAHGGEIVLDRSRTLTHTLVIGPTGAGKTRSIYMPNLGHRRTDSFVATDPKGEMWSCTSRFHARVRRYSPLEPDASLAFNWIPRCRDAGVALLLGRALSMQRKSGDAKASDFFWLEGEALILAAIFAHVAELAAPTPVTALNLLTGLKTNEIIELLERSPSRAARKLISGLNHGDDTKLRSGFMVGVVNALMFLADDNLARFTSSTIDGADFTELRHWPIGVYWVLPQADVARLQGVSSLFFNLLLYDIKHAKGGTGVTLFIDEAGNIGRIPDLAQEVTLVRDLNIAFVFGLQSFSQWDALYDRSDTKTITDNCLTWFVLPGLRPNTAEEVSRALGDRTVLGASDGHSSTRSGLWSGKASYSDTRGHSEKARRLLTADEVRRLPKRNAIVLCDNHFPIKVTRHHSTLGPSAPKSVSPCGDVLADEFKA